jgi:hypothetical protein
MSAKTERQKKIEDVSGKIATIAAVDPDSLSRTEELSREINFSAAVPYFREMIDIVRQLDQRDLSRLPTPELDQIDKSINALQGFIEQVRTFSLVQTTNPSEASKTLIEQVSSAYDRIVHPLLVPLSFTATQATDYARLEREARGVHATIKEEHEKITSYLAEVKLQAANALDAVQKQAAEAGVSQNAQIFESAAKDSLKSADNWLLATEWSAATTFIIALALLLSPLLYTPATTPQSIQLIFSKILVISVAFFVLVWCSKNYRAARHNEVLNQHRANALKTFRAFVEGTADVSIKDAILIQASQAAFSCRSTGFDGGDVDEQQVQPLVEALGRTLPALARN